MTVCADGLSVCCITMELAKHRKENITLMLEIAEPMFYIATSGCDAWSGKLPEPNEAGTDGPFATLDRARMAVREAKPYDSHTSMTVFPKDGLMRYDIIVEILGGTYFLDKTVVFDEKDSAHWYKRIVYKAHKDEKPIFTSACPIEGWMLTKDKVAPEADGKVWEAPLPKSVGLCNAIYDAGGLLPRSRSKLFFPGLENTFESASSHEQIPFTGNPNIDTLSEEKKRKFAFRFPEGLVYNWDNLEDVEIYVRSVNWTMNLLPLQRVDEKTRTACVSVPGTYPIASRGDLPSVAVENRIELVKAEGQWAVDTRKRKIYLWPRTEKPENIVVPTLPELIRVEGRGSVDTNDELPVRGISFHGLTFTGGKRDVWTLRDSGMQHDWEMLDKPDALVRFKNAWRCGVENCTFMQSGGTGVRMDLYAQNCFVTGCRLHHLGQGGVMLLGYGPGTKDVNSHNAVVNCTIHDLGEIYTHSHGIALFQSSENRIAHNYIYNMPRKAICVNGVRLYHYLHPEDRDRRECAKSIRWNEIKLPVKRWEDVMVYSHTRGNVIEYNNVERCLMKMSDGSAINLSGAGTGNVVRRNYVHNIYSAPGEGLAGAIRTDDDQIGTYIYENVIAHTNCSCYEYKRANYFNNNVIFDVDPDGMLAFSIRWGEPDQGTFERNIFVDVFGDSCIYANYHDLGDAYTMSIDYNLYYRYPAGKRHDRSPCHLWKRWGKPDPRIPFDADLRLLRNLGQDTNSAYDIDPILMDADNDDFRLSENSPAHAMGILPIDITKTGPQEDYQ